MLSSTIKYVSISAPRHHRHFEKVYRFRDTQGIIARQAKVRKRHSRYGWTFQDQQRGETLDGTADFRLSIKGQPWQMPLGQIHIKFLINTCFGHTPLLLLSLPRRCYKSHTSIEDRIELYYVKYYDYYFHAFNSSL